MEHTLQYDKPTVKTFKNNYQKNDNYNQQNIGKLIKLQSEYKNKLYKSFQHIKKYQ